MRENDQWEDAGAFLYRNMPETSLDDFFREERIMLRISQEMGKWWLAEDGVQGESVYETLDEAKDGGDAIIEKAEAHMEAKLLKESGLDPKSWRIVVGDGVAFHSRQDRRSIVMDHGSRRGGGQMWIAMDDNDIISEGHREAKDALLSLQTAPV